MTGERIEKVIISDNLGLFPKFDKRMEWVFISKRDFQVYPHNAAKFRLSRCRLGPWQLYFFMDALGDSLVQAHMTTVPRGVGGCAGLSFRSIYDIPATVNYSIRGDGGGQEKREELKHTGLALKELYSLVEERGNMTR